MPTETHTLHNKCPHCGRIHDRVCAADGSDVKPEPGAVSVCFVCGGLGVFTIGTHIRAVTKSEFTEFKQSAEWAAYERAMAWFGIQRVHPGQTSSNDYSTGLVI